ncbi:hypothetical protein C0J52_07016 [Blattella germanica]|nr:hypothetical protein C0J52_07016 [Blattella germanica]
MDGWMDGLMDRGFPQELPTRCLVGVRRATLWTRGFGSMSRAEMALMDRGFLQALPTSRCLLTSTGELHWELINICSGHTQSSTVDSGIWQHVEGRDGIRWIVVYLRHYQPVVW